MLQKDDKVRCIRSNGGGVKVGDIGIVLSNTGEGYYLYKVWFESMTHDLKQRGYWVGNPRHLELVVSEANVLYY